MPADLTMIDTPNPLGAVLRDFGIESVTYCHPPVFTVEEGRDFKPLIPGGHTKNLFVRDKKQKTFLVTAQWDTVVDMAALSGLLGAGRLSFGSADRLWRVLGVIPGAVTPFALINCAGDGDLAVQPVLDAALLRCGTVNAHPLQNDMTTNVRAEDLVEFMKKLGFTPKIVDFKAMCLISE